MSAPLPTILVIVGPTASGKSALALSVAQQFGGEIISADSRQVYRYLNIGTAKPSREELKIVKHHFVDSLDPSEEYNAGLFESEATAVINDLVRKKRLPVVVGGSGLYIKSLIDGLSDAPSKDEDIRTMLGARQQSEGLEGLVSLLNAVDPRTLQEMKEVTPRRVIRALEVYYVSGRPFSQIHAAGKKHRSFQAYQVGLLWDRTVLYQRIEHRVEAMIASGLVDEVRSLRARGYDRHLNALNTVGYKEVFDFLDGVSSMEAMTSLIKQNTRRFAKRQMTWFRRDARIHWTNVSGDTWLEQATKEVVRRVSSRRGFVGSNTS
jgi:tRNA dimethylallyltransferase